MFAFRQNPCWNGPWRLQGYETDYITGRGDLYMRCRTYVSNPCKVICSLRHVGLSFPQDSYIEGLAPTPLETGIEKRRVPANPTSHTRPPYLAFGLPRSPQTLTSHPRHSVSVSSRSNTSSVVISLFNSTILLN